MLGYFSLFLILILIQYSHLNSNVKLLIFYFILVFFTGLRYNIGYDYMSYTENIENQWYSSEPIPAFFQWLAHYTDNSLFFFLSSAFIYAFYFLGIKNASKDKIGSVYFFLAFPFLYFSSLSTVRQSMALAVIFYLITLRDCSIKKKIIFIVIAFLSHTSALIGILLFIPWKKIPIWMLSIIFISSQILSIIIIKIIFAIQLNNILYLKLLNYIEEGENYLGGSKTSILVYAITIITICLSRKIKKYDPQSSSYIPLIILGGSLYAIFSVYDI